MISAVPEAGIIMIGVFDSFFGGFPCGCTADGGPNPGRLSRDGGGTGWLLRPRRRVSPLFCELNESLRLLLVEFKLPPRIALNEVPWKDRLVSI